MTGGHGQPGLHARSPAEVRAARQASRRLLAMVLAVALSVAGVVGIAATLQGSFGGDDVRVLIASLSFAIFSATAAAGAALRRERPGLGGAVGVATVALSGLAWLTLVPALWSYDAETARICGVTALLALAGSHASIVVRARRASDGPVVHTLGIASILLATFESVSGALIVSGSLRVSDSEAFVRTGGTLLIATVVTTALPPLLRAAAKKPPPPRTLPAAVPPPPPPPPTGGPAAPRPRLSPVAVCVMGLVAVVAVFSLGQATRPRASWAAAAARWSYRQPTPPPVAAYSPPPVAAAPVAPPPPAPVSGPPPEVVLAGAPEHLRPAASRPLGPGIEARPVFTCPAGRGALERGGPHDRVQLRRTSTGLCVRSRSTAIPSSAVLGATNPVLTVRFHSRERPKQPDFVVQLAVESRGPYFALSAGWADGVRTAVTAGNVGVARRQLSLLVEAPQVPSWVLDPNRSTWKAELP